MNKAQSQTLDYVGLCDVYSINMFAIQDCFEIMFFSMTAFQYLLILYIFNSFV